MKTLTIDQEFKNLIPGLTASEYSQLEENILQHGIRDAIITWKNDIIIDGHNRYEIAQKHNLEFKTHKMLFPSRELVTNFIINNQMGRRNITEEQKAYLIGKRYENEKKLRGGQGYNQYKKEQMDENPPIATNEENRTSKILAKEYNTSSDTVKQNERFAKGLDILPESIKQNILSGNQKETKEDIKQIALLQNSPRKEEILSGIEKKEISIKEAANMVRNKTAEKTKREIKDEMLRENINKNRELRKRLILEKVQYMDVLITDKSMWGNIQDQIKENNVVWIIRNEQESNKMAAILRQSKFKIENV